MSEELSGYWNDRYNSADETTFGWYQPVPSTLSLVLKYAERSSWVVDVGAGKSLLVDHLLKAGLTNITLLDISNATFPSVKERLGESGETPTYVEHDLRTWTPTSRFDIWHDRAVLHFLTSREDIDKYCAALDRALSAEGHAIIAVFAEKGPESCAGLPVQRYNVDTLAAALSPIVELHSSRQSSVSVEGDARPYIECVFTRPPGER